jgi:hypothetical protein
MRDPGFLLPLKLLGAVVLAMVCAGCAAQGGNANLGPDPGGGFYCPNNIFEGCVNPAKRAPAG